MLYTATADVHEKPADTIEESPNNSKNDPNSIETFVNDDNAQ